MPPNKPPATNAVNMMDLYANTNTAGQVVVPLTNPCTVKPALTYARGQLTDPLTVMSDSGGSLIYPAGTPLKTVSITAGLTQCTVELSGPKGEKLPNVPVLVFFAAFEKAK